MGDLRRRLAAGLAGWWLALLLSPIARAQQVQIAAPVLAVPVPVALSGVAAVAPISLQAVTPVALPSLAVPLAPALTPSIALPKIAIAAAGPAAIAESGSAAQPYGRIAAERPAFSGLAQLADRLSPAARHHDRGRDREGDLGRYFDSTKSRESDSAPAVDASGSAAPVAPVAQAQLEGLTGRPLLDAVRQAAQQGQGIRDYKEARHAMYGVVDHVQRGGQSGILEAYTQTFVPGTSDNGGDYRSGIDADGRTEMDKQGINAEHVWPQSFFESKLPMRSDLHNLLPTFVSPNGLRGHLPFGEVTGRPEYSNRAGAKLGGGVFEPPAAVKGKIARALLYFVTRYQRDAVREGDYGENFWNSRVDMFMRWNREHPPDAAELQRNDRIQAFQGNRNPFIDDPTLADRIGAQALRFGGKDGLSSNFNPGAVKPHFGREALIESARMTPHGQLRQGGGLLRRHTAGVAGR
ncbi:MAG: endonuclease [Elusimicrobia bacterium]|nr:endonuclease [Elusimicrobiota bacterium]